MKKTIVLGVIYHDRERWLAFLYSAILFTGFSLSWAYSLGGFLWPLGIILLVVSAIKLRQYRLPKSTAQEASK